MPACKAVNCSPCISQEKNDMADPRIHHDLDKFVTRMVKAAKVSLKPLLLFNCMSRSLRRRSS